MKNTTNPEAEQARASLLRSILSQLPGLSDYEQGAAIEARQQRQELLEMNGAWYERVDLNLRDEATGHGRVFVEGDAMPEDRPDVVDRRFVGWSWNCDEEGYLSELGEVCSWGKLLRLFGGVVAPLREGQTLAAAAERQKRAEAEARPHADEPLHWRTEDGGIAAVMCGSCSTLGGHSDDCPTTRPAPERRVWRAGDSEPDEDGLRLTDRDGDVWTQLEPQSWSCNGDDAHAVDWDSALNCGPLTEVSCG